MPDTPNPQPPVTDREWLNVQILAGIDSHHTTVERLTRLLDHACLQAREIERLRKDVAAQIITGGNLSERVLEANAEIAALRARVNELEAQLDANGDPLPGEEKP